MKYGVGPLLSKEWHFVKHFLRFGDLLEIIKFPTFFGKRHNQTRKNNPIVCIHNSSTKQRLIDFLMAQTQRDEPCQTYVICRSQNQ